MTHITTTDTRTSQLLQKHYTTWSAMTSTLEMPNSPPRPTQPDLDLTEDLNQNIMKWYFQIFLAIAIISWNTLINYILYYTETILYHTIWTTVNSKCQTLKLYSFEDQIFRTNENKNFYNNNRKLKEYHSVMIQ